VSAEAALVHFEGFSFTYEDAQRPALSDISFQIPAGHLVGILGAEGSGRTSLFRALNGTILEAFPGKQSGKAIVCGHDVATAGHSLIGLETASIFDDADSQIVNLTVWDEVAFALVQRGYPKKETEERVGEALAEVGLSGMEGRSTTSLSGGQKQRLVTASALALRPRLILLDESSSALDPQGSRELYGLIRRRIERDGLSAVAVEPDVNLVLEFCDTVFVLAEGRLAFSGTPAELAQRRDLVESAGLCLPDWHGVIGELASRGLYEGPYPATLAEAAAIVSGIEGFQEGSR
jgi:energy-coupling factor transporter ATP-binding protein EcfA2